MFVYLKQTCNLIVIPFVSNPFFFVNFPRFPPSWQLLSRTMPRMLSSEDSLWRNEPKHVLKYMVWTTLESLQGMLTNIEDW